mmetsp:Transcript_11704/g.45609  ORF Transcript_11704/g.45609 Transcript_11704/m.45609 type:complete len:474 (-) Transcript_11704:1616-3037(-)
MQAAEVRAPEPTVRTVASGAAEWPDSPDHGCHVRHRRRRAPAAGPRSLYRGHRRREPERRGLCGHVLAHPHWRPCAGTRALAGGHCEAESAAFSKAPDCHAVVLGPCVLARSGAWTQRLFAAMMRSERCYATLSESSAGTAAGSSWLGSTDRRRIGCSAAPGACRTSPLATLVRWTAVVWGWAASRPSPSATFRVAAALARPKPGLGREGDWVAKPQRPMQAALRGAGVPVRGCCCSTKMLLPVAASAACRRLRAAVAVWQRAGYAHCGARSCAGWRCMRAGGQPARPALVLEHCRRQSQRAATDRNIGPRCSAPAQPGPWRPKRGALPARGHPQSRRPRPRSSLEPARAERLTPSMAWSTPTGCASWVWPSPAPITATSCSSGSTCRLRRSLPTGRSWPRALGWPTPSSSLPRTRCTLPRPWRLPISDTTSSSKNQWRCPLTTASASPTRPSATTCCWRCATCCATRPTCEK